MSTRTCTSIHHQYHSPHFKDQVPIELFRKVPDDPHSYLTKTCKDCRNYSIKCRNNTVARKRAAEIPEGLFLCAIGMHQKPESERGKTLNGDNSESCEECLQKSRITVENRGKDLQQLKRDTIKKNRCSCVKCKRIFLQSREKRTVVYLQVIDSIVDYDGKSYPVDDFLKQFQDELELSVLEYDHLTEEEQRQRGILKPDDVFVPKINCVSNMGSLPAMVLEARKCELLCVECHLEATISREGGGTRSMTYLSKQKEAYVNALKDQGCAVCHKSCNGKYRIFDMDHIDPTTKSMCVATMICNDNYSLDDTKRECVFTRPLCRFCHRVHTRLETLEAMATKRRKLAELQEEKQ